ncbi:MAG: helix-turn-helix domain-containing protein [Gaiellales bacterium]
MLEIGATLKNAREQHGRSLDDAAEATKIRSSYLVALEEDAFERLPGPTYARGFLRSYSDYLGLDPQVLIDEFNVRFAAAPWEVDDEVMFPRRRTARSPRRGRESSIVVVAVAGILAIAVLVVIASTYPSTRETPVPAVSAATVVTVTEEAVNPVATAVTAQTAPDSTSAAAQAVVYVRPTAQTTLTVRALGQPDTAQPIFQQELNPDPAKPDGIKLPRSASGYLIRLDRPNTITLIVNGSPVVPGPTDTLLSVDPNGRVAAVSQ